MMFQASNYKERNFLNLKDNKEEDICPTYTKEKAWLKHFGLSNSLYTQITKLITNNTPIGEHKLKFFSKELIAYLCGNYPIKIRRHILFKYQKYNKC